MDGARRGRDRSTSVIATPNLDFDGLARQALDFHRSEFGGDLSIATSAHIDAVEAESQAGEVAFERLDAPGGFSMMAYDVQPSKAYEPGMNPFYVTLHGAHKADIHGLWNDLAESATEILIPARPAFSRRSTAFSPVASRSAGSSGDAAAQDG